MNEYQKINDAIVRLKDTKVVARLKDGKIVPTAPVYYRLMDQFLKVCGHIKEEVVEEKTDELIEPVKSKKFGPYTYGYPTWLHRTNPERAKEIYKGKLIPEYEALTK
mgnify:CR=1 FL=1|tara:strand:+ start:508 stop:828 length:321 start_codon:yes stop_codon:yes gene_type:complete